MLWAREQGGKTDRLSQNRQATLTTLSANIWSSRGHSVRIRRAMKFEDFSVVDFPARDSLSSPAGFVYVFCWVADGVETPFYVGQTKRFSGRMNDYDLANFKACTDFCVGEAVKYLTNTKKVRVVVRHRPSPEPLKEEKTIVRRLLVSGVWLLNCLPRYDYRIDSENEERAVVHSFCDMFIGSRTGQTSGD